MNRIAITQGDVFLAFARNAKAIPLPDGTTAWGPVKTFPRASGGYTIRAVIQDGPEPGPDEIGGTEPPVVEGDNVVLRRTVTPCPPEQVAARLAAVRNNALLAVQTECQRRLAAGFDYDFGDARGTHRIGTSERDMAGWDEVTMLAQALINAGNATAAITIATDTGICDVTPQEWNSILLAASAFRQPIWQASFALQGADPVPADYANDAYWPAE